MSAVNRPNNPCPNPHCGNTLYTAAYAFDADCQNPKPVWRCTNCATEQPRLSRNRRTNAQRAHALHTEIKAEWAETDEQLRKLVDSGTPSGCMLVYSSAFNYHMDKLLMASNTHKSHKLTTWEVKRHAAEARRNLEEGKLFIAGKIRYAKLQ